MTSDDERPPEPEPTQLADQVGETAKVIEVERVKRADNLERERLAWTRHIQKQMIAMALFLVACFLLLGWRSEVNNDHITANTAAIAAGIAADKQAAYDACLVRQERTNAINPGRQAVTDLLLHLVDNDTALTQEQRLTARAVLEGGLLVTVEDCGNAPTGN